MAHLQCVQIIPGSRYDVYKYMTSPEHLSEQLSGLIEVKWQNPGIEIAVGCEFLFVMSRYGIEQPIRFVVDRFVTGHSLTYRQVSGLFSRYVHTMKFEDHGQGETLVTDLVEYEIPLGLIGRILDDFYLRRDMMGILKFRMDKVRTFFLEKLNENVSKIINEKVNSPEDEDSSQTGL